MDVSGYAPTRPTDLPPRVLLLLDRDSDGGRPIQEALRSHGCQVVAVPRSAVAADPRSVSLLDVDLVLGYGPHNGSLLALRTLEDRARGLTARPVFSLVAAREPAQPGVAGPSRSLPECVPAQGRRLARIDSGLVGRAMSSPGFARASASASWVNSVVWPARAAAI